MSSLLKCVKKVAVFKFENNLSHKDKCNINYKNKLDFLESQLYQNKLYHKFMICQYIKVHPICCRCIKRKYWKKKNFLMQYSLKFVFRIKKPYHSSSGTLPQQSSKLHRVEEGGRINPSLIITPSAIKLTIVELGSCNLNKYYGRLAQKKS